jgi:hypothetical protein
MSEIPRMCYGKKEKLLSENSVSGKLNKDILTEMDDYLTPWFDTSKIFFLNGSTALVDAGLFSFP